jgi:hypothetical protein
VGGVVCYKVPLNSSSGHAFVGAVSNNSVSSVGPRMAGLCHHSLMLPHGLVFSNYARGTLCLSSTGVNTNMPMVPVLRVVTTVALM